MLASNLQKMKTQAIPTDRLMLAYESLGGEGADS